jgi:NADPH:quinone reductase-like Zn-dependent oxidoreductase
MQDILVAMSLVDTGPRVFGYEGAGIIRRVGSNVNSLSVGDHVAVVQHYTFATTLITPAMFCARIPDGLCFDQASTMLIPYMTALHSLITVGGLQKGQVSLFNNLV